MATSSKGSTMSNDIVKKPKGLKDYMKTQKQKTKAKRADAAEKSKMQKTAAAVRAKEKATIKDTTPDSDSSSEHPTVNKVEAPATTISDVEVVSLNLAIDQDAVDCDQEHTVAMFETKTAPEASIAQVDEIVSTHKVAMIQDDVEDASSSQIVDIRAHRKALEDALYENMETPKKMLARLSFAISADAEYHKDAKEDKHLVTLEELDVDNFTSPAKCLDGNGFKITPVSPDQPDDALIAYSPSIDELFSMVSSTGASVVGSAHSVTSRTLESIESIELQQANEIEHASSGPKTGCSPFSISIDQLFSMVSSSGASVVGLAKSDTSRTLESIELQQANETEHASSAPKTGFKPISIDQLFAAASSTGASVVGSANPDTSQTLGSIELQQANETNHASSAPQTGFKPISIDLLFAAASRTNTNIVGLSSNANKASTARTLEFIESEMMVAVRDRAMNPQAPPFMPFFDPAIGSMKVKDQEDDSIDTLESFSISKDTMQFLENIRNEGSKKLKSLLGITSSPASSFDGSRHSRATSWSVVDSARTPPTNYSVSPLPVDIYGHGFDGDQYQMWACDAPGVNNPYSPHNSCYPAYRHPFIDAKEYAPTFATSPYYLEHMEQQRISAQPCYAYGRHFMGYAQY